MTRALLVVPPFIKYAAGPLLGPALLQGAAEQQGHQCAVLDLNAHFIRCHSPKSIVDRGRFVGDHDKPQVSSSHSVLSDIERKFISENILPNLDIGFDDEAMRRIRFGFLQHEEVEGAATKLAASWFGVWTQNLLLKQLDLEEKWPKVFGVSLLHSGQVIPAAAISMVARKLWPETLVLWGGPHISGIGTVVQEDLQDRSFAADLFVAGHAEQTFVHLLNKIHCSKSNVRPCAFEQGCRGDSIAPVFHDLDLYDDPPVLPAQSSLGCPYGRCKFCTYPAMEPTPTKLDLCISIDSVVKRAHAINATVAIKDSLATPQRLQELGTTIGGRVKWSACTKLSGKLNAELLNGLCDNGLATLEVGLESLLVDTQCRVAKVHPPGLYEEFLANSAKVPGLSVVVNYMTGFPWEDPSASQSKLEEAKRLLTRHLGPRGKLEHNHFELERLSPMAREPELFDMDGTSLEFWPWASVVDYKVR